MRKLSPTYVVTAVVLALAGSTAFAQTAAAPGARATVTQTGNTTPAPTRTTAGTASTTGAGCQGTNGSTCTTTTAGTTDAGSGTTPSGTMQNTNSPMQVQPGSGSASSTTAATGSSGATTNSTGTTTNSTANGVNNANTTGVLPGNTGFGVVVPPSDTSASTGANGNQASTSAPAAPQSTTIIMSTPLLDQATRDELAREAKQRRTGQQPRIIGIAPRTNADKTNQMPDDPVIRY